jgi:hypothetical protein
MAGRHLDALASSEDIYSELEIVADSFDGRILIESVATHSFLCFTKRGQLTIKLPGSADHRCVFREVFSDDHYSEFQSADDSSLFVGFGKNGKKMTGHRWSKRRRATRSASTFDVPYDSSRNEFGVAEQTPLTREDSYDVREVNSVTGETTNTNASNRQLISDINPIGLIGKLNEAVHGQSVHKQHALRTKREKRPGDSKAHKCYQFIKMTSLIDGAIGGHQHTQKHGPDVNFDQVYSQVRTKLQKQRLSEDPT